MTIPDNKYASMSRDYLARAENYLRQGDLAQASGKSLGCGSLWPEIHRRTAGLASSVPFVLYDLSGQVADELDRQDLRDLFAVANTMHHNFYENWFQEDEVEYGIGRVKEYLAELEAVSSQLPGSFVVETRAQRRRLERLTGQSDPL